MTTLQEEQEEEDKYKVSSSKVSQDPLWGPFLTLVRCLFRSERQIWVFGRRDDESSTYSKQNARRCIRTLVNFER